MSADGAGSDGGIKQRFELYIKASAIDKETKGSCPICQHWFMITCLLGENQDDIDFKVYTVQADCPPKNFGVEQGWSKKFPVVMVLEGRDKKGQDLVGTKYDTFEELEIFFENINKDSKELKRKNAPNVAAMKAVENVYNAFNTFLSSGGKMDKKLRNELKKINEFLDDDKECKFLLDDVLSFADCYLLPRLQHIRVAGKEYLDFDIPKEHTMIWKYLADAYQTEAFRSTMPSDQDIIFHYEKKVGNLGQGQKRRPRPTLQNFTYTLDIPEDIAAMLQESAAASANGDVSQLQAPVDEMEAVDISPQQQQQEEEEFPVGQQEAVVGGDVDEVAADADGGVAEEGVMVEQAADPMAFMEQAVCEGVPTAAEEMADEVVQAEDSGLTDASPAVEETQVEDTTATGNVQTAESFGADESAVTGDGVDTAATPSTDIADAVGDNVTQVNLDAVDSSAGGVTITIGQHDDSDAKIMGNGDVVGEKHDLVTKDNVAIINTDDGVVNVDGGTE